MEFGKETTVIHNYILFKQICGFLFLLDLIFFLPQASLWLGEGYSKKAWWNQKPVFSIILLLWALSAIGLMTHTLSWISIAILLLLFRYFYIYSRWNSLLRGVGAVGFMPHWVTFYLFLLESSLKVQDHGLLTEHFLRMARWDFAFIFICAGTYKGLTGYFQGEGVEYGLANPIWTYFYSFFKKTDPKNKIYRTLNIAASIGQISIASSLLIPGLQTLGALGLMGGFTTISIFFRIGRLGPLMVAIGLLFLPELGFHFGHPAHLQSQTWNVSSSAISLSILNILYTLTWIYIGLLPIVKIVQYMNLFFNISLPPLLQTAFNRYTGFFPIIIWRVFTTDLTNFFVRIYKQTTPEIELVTENTVYRLPYWENFALQYRYLHVGESVCIATLFNTIKLFSSRPELFHDKLLRYAATIPNPEQVPLRFQYVLLTKGTEKHMNYTPIANYFVNVKTHTITEEKLTSERTVATKAKFSPIRESTGYGSYVKKD